MAIWNKVLQKLNNNNTQQYEVVMLADKDGNIINTFGAASNIPIAAGEVDGYSNVHKFGMIDGSSGTDWSTIWTAADTASTKNYPWGITAGTVSIISAVDDDTDGGAGAHTITVEGLDANYNPVSESFTLSGETETGEGSIVFHRVNRAYITGGNTNLGKIQIKNGTEVVAEIAAGMGQTQMCVYTIPAGKTGYLTRVAASSSKNISTVISLFQRPHGQVFIRTASSMALYQNNQHISLDVPLPFSEKTDLDLRQLGASNNTIAADFNIILVDNPS
jgi:hypothetical protein